MREQARFEPSEAFDDLSLQDWEDAMLIFEIGRRQVESSLAAARIAEGLGEESPPIRAVDLSNAMTIVGRVPIVGSLRDEFLKWWLNLCESVFADDEIDGHISSPFNSDNDDDVRVYIRNQIVALTAAAKRKLAKRLRERARKHRERSASLRAAGNNAEADRQERIAHHFDVAAEECEK
jgi:hypothetical protein